MAAFGIASFRCDAQFCPLSGHSGLWHADRPRDLWVHGLKPDGTEEPSESGDTAVAKPVPMPAPETVVISHGRGGLVAEHELKFFTYWHSNNKVEIRGGCYSACTLVTAFIGKDKLCIAEGAFLAFHAVSSMERREIMPAATERLYWLQPLDIRRWIDRAGGYQNLPLNGFWTMYDRELWAMGYPKCN